MHDGLTCKSIFLRASLWWQRLVFHETAASNLARNIYFSWSKAQDWLRNRPCEIETSNLRKEKYFRWYQRDSNKARQYLACVGYRMLQQPEHYSSQSVYLLLSALYRNFAPDVQIADQKCIPRTCHFELLSCSEHGWDIAVCNAW